MKVTIKQRILLTISAILLLIPTFIAISTFYSDTSGGYEISVKNETFDSVSLPSYDMKRLAALIMKAVNNLSYAERSVIDLPEKYYYITVKKNGEVLSSIKWYMSTDKNVDSYAVDDTGTVFKVRKKDAERLLSKEFAYHFYVNAFLPRLSINNGDEIAPSDSKWSYRALNGSVINSIAPRESSIGLSYPVDELSKLTFSHKPQKCLVKLYDKNVLVDSFSSIDELPPLRSGLKIEINASWQNNDCSGFASYEFYTGDMILPIYSFGDTNILSGEFFTVKAENVISPHNIEFSSIPEIHTVPTFYEIEDSAYALIPINKDLSAPCNYTFSFKYGNNVQQFTVSVEPRAVRHDKECHISLPLNDKSLNRTYKIFQDNARKSENICRFVDGFADYAPTNNETAIADVFYGFGHNLKDTTSLFAYRLDGVIYIFPNSAEIPSLCDGRVIAIGSDSVLGHYVAIDHGLGLITWYCRLSALTVCEGDSIDKGDTIGISGNTGFGDINGVYLITTVGGIPVSPYPLQNK